MDTAKTPPDPQPDMLYRLPYEATLTVMAPWGDGPEARALRRRLLAARDIASRELGRGGNSEEMRWVIGALLRISAENCYRRDPHEALDLAVEFAVLQWQAMTVLRRLEALDA